MEVNFSDSFFNSIKALNRRQTWWYKTYEFFRFNLPRFFKNIWIFRKVLWNHRWWDYRYTLEVLRTSLEVMERGMHNGIEVRESRDKKIAKMQRVIQIIKNVEGDLYLEMAEEKLGKKYMTGDWEFEPVEGKEGVSQLKDNLTPAQEKVNKKISDLSRKLESDEWNELWNILKGQDYQKIPKDVEFNKWFNGSGLNTWWD
jgi:hypothetical protein